MLYGALTDAISVAAKAVLILIFLENALRHYLARFEVCKVDGRLNPYFFGKCSTAPMNEVVNIFCKGLNPYFFGKCSTANYAHEYVDV